MKSNAVLLFFCQMVWKKSLKYLNIPQRKILPVPIEHLYWKPLGTSDSYCIAVSADNELAANGRLKAIITSCLSMISLPYINKLAHDWKPFVFLLLYSTFLTNTVTTYITALQFLHRQRSQVIPSLVYLLC